MLSILWLSISTLSSNTAGERGRKKDLSTTLAKVATCPAAGGGKRSGTITQYGHGRGHVCPTTGGGRGGEGAGESRVVVEEQERAGW